MSEKEEEQKNQEDFKAQWDKQKQETQQAEANYQKAVEEKQVISAENATLSVQLENIQRYMEELEAKVKAQEDAKTDPDFDPDKVDPNVIKELQRARTAEKELMAKVKELEGKASTYEQTEKQRAAKAAEDRAVNKICTSLDEEFGPQFRNDAIALAKKLVKDGKEQPIEDGIDGTILMRKCYKQLSEKAKSKGEDDVPTDTGAGGLTPDKTVVKGDTQDVLADMRQNKGWLQEPLGPGEPDIF